MVMCAVVVEHGQDALDVWRDPELDLNQEVEPVFDAALGVACSEDCACCRNECTKDKTTTSVTVVQLDDRATSGLQAVARSRSRLSGANNATAAVRRGPYRAHLVEA